MFKYMLNTKNILAKVKSHGIKFNVINNNLYCCMLVHEAAFRDKIQEKVEYNSMRKWQQQQQD